MLNPLAGYKRNCSAPPPTPTNRKIKTSSKNAFCFMHMSEE